MLYACQVVYTLFTGQREIKRERDKERLIKRERERGREEERVCEGGREGVCERGSE